MTTDAQPFEGGRLTPLEQLADEILATDDIEGLTVSGGEPFTQAAGLAALVQRVRARRALGLIVYSGYRLEALKQMAQDDIGVAELLGQIDLLIDGPYVEALNDGAPLRGSANQRVLPLTGRYLESLHCYERDQPRGVELHVEIGERMLVGVPSAHQLAWWHAQKTNESTTTSTEADNEKSL
jgi:anaerobic ribonucleoside-triphosphate reductase activating protein